MKQLKSANLTIVVTKKSRSRHTIAQLLLFVLCMVVGLAIYRYVDVMLQMKPLIPQKLNVWSFQSELHSVKRKGLLILTYHRSGSTFLGQYFNQRPDSFYVFEPLITFEDYCSGHLNETLKVQHLSDLFNCRFRDQREIFKLAGKPEDGETVSGENNRCIPNNFCFRQKIKLLCSEKFCRQGKPQTCSKCEAVNLEAVSEECLSSELIVIKVIRMCQLKNLLPLIQDPNLDFKVLHLIRDPRGVYNSRDKVLGDEVELLVNNTCQIIHENAQYVIHENKDWMKSKYKIIRYEDLCRKPFKTAEDIYEFVGLEMTPEMYNWILHNTQESTSNLGDVHSNKLANNLLHSKHLRHLNAYSKKKYVKKKLLSHPYATTRNSSSVWVKWKKELDEKKLEFVQSNCKDMMHDIGYEMLDNLNVNETFKVITDTCPSDLLNYCTFS